MSRMRVVLAGILLATTLAGCGLSDAQVAWCKSHPGEVYQAAQSLGVAAAGEPAKLAASAFGTIDWWALWGKADSSGRDRSCGSAYGSR